MKKGIVAAAALLLSFNADAQEVVLHKCLDGSGVPIYQSEPCPRGQQPAGVVRDWVYRSPEVDRAIERRRRQRHAGAQYLEQLAGTGQSSRRTRVSVQRDRGMDACDRARLQRKQYMDANHGNYAIRDALDDAVMEACY